ncbi:MAG TPA: ATP-binding protein [Pyrinomonadaceae bacterium]|jgi:signal transduction histidine kinase
MNFFNTFRGRLLIVLACLLIATLGVQYFINLQTERRNKRYRERQEQALVAGIALGFNGMQSRDRLSDIVKQENQRFFDESITNRIKDIIVINDKWQVYDSLNPDYQETEDENGNTIYKNLKDLQDLPPLLDAERLGADKENFPNAGKVESETDEAEAHAIPIQTDQGRFYVMVLLKTNRAKAAWNAARPLFYTLSIFSVSTIITIFLVWRFTRPIANLSDAAKRIADGDLTVRVPHDKRSDEMGRLASRFNEMTAELEKKSELETMLQEAEKSAVVGRLGSAIAHEIRNPLNYINLTLDHLRAKFAPEEAGKRRDFEKLTLQLKSEVARINQQITDFLSYSRPPKLNLETTDLKTVVKDSLRIVEAEAREQHININFAENGGAPKVFGDAEYLRSVFNNLFINAVQSMATNGGNLNVSIEPLDAYVKIEVEDTGSGIPEENLSKIFEPYFSTKETGTGLGLAIVKRVVDEHRGVIGVESKINEGTTFTVRLPKA